MAVFGIVCLSVLGVSLLVAGYIVARFLWIRHSLDRLYTLLISKLINDMALLYVAEKWNAILKLRAPHYEEFAEACGDRVVWVFFHPFCWNRYYLLPDLNTATTLRTAFENGIATDSDEEHMLRSNAFIAQIKEEQERQIEEED